MKKLLFFLFPFFLLAQPGDGHINISVYGNTGFWPCTKYENVKVLAYEATYPLKQNYYDENDFDYEKPNLKSLKFLGEFKCIPSKKEFKDYPLDSFYYDSCMNPDVVAIIQNKDTMYINTSSADACYDWMVDATGTTSDLPFFIKFKKGLFQLRDIKKDRERLIMQNNIYLDYLIKFKYNDRYFIPDYVQKRIDVFETSRSIYDKDDFIFLRFKENIIVKNEGQNYAYNRHIYWALQKLNESQKWEIIVPFPEFEFEIELQVLSNEDPKLKIIPLFQYKWENEKLNYNIRNQPVLPSGTYRLLIFDDLSQPYFSNEFVLK